MVVDSMKGIVDIGIILDDSIVLSGELKPILLVAVKFIAALLVAISEVCKLILEVSIMIVDEAIGGLGMGDTNDEKELVKVMLEVILLKLTLVKNPLPSISELLKVDASIVELKNILLVGTKNVEAIILSSIPLPSPLPSIPILLNLLL